MKRLLALVALALAPLCLAQTTVSPILQPHQTFVDNSGNPCAGCSLYSYAAGTTTPLATYTDSTGTSQNTNPIVLGSAGGANIWLGTSSTYKFALSDASGNLLWTVDNVKGSGGGGILPCASSYTIQFASSTANQLACDANITINPTSHALQIGGAITGPSFTLKNLAAITSSWTLDVTSPSTALRSFGAIPLGDLANQTPDTLVMNATGASGAPTAVSLPSGCLLGVNYSTASHSWTCALTSVPLANVAPQGADTVVMNATGASASPTAVGLPTGCANGVNYNTTSHTWNCVTPTTPMTLNSAAGSRTFGSVYQNTTGAPILVSGYGQISGGSGDSTITCSVGTTSATGSNVYANTTTGTVPGEPVGFFCSVPVNWYYQVNVTGRIASTPVNWYEAVL